MSYQALARKWRPRRFEDVVGQPGVTRTLRNAIDSGRIAHAYVFAGPRGVGKTTTARILARALNCVKGPTSDPCGECDACVEIAEGRDIDVLEIDAATHTQVDKVRETIISGLGFAPVRDRYKVFVIDEVHRLSQPAFDALLKSIEEPPDHVIFMMATTALDKVPGTVQSRSQVFELKSIGLKEILAHLSAVAAAESLQVDPAAMMLIARAADGSVRDALSALDQVLGFAGTMVDAESVTTVLGLVRRDLILDMIDAVAKEDAPAVFALAARAVESGYDLRQVCRELARAARDLLVVGIDASRAADPEIAQESERARLQELAKLFSHEDLMRAFDVLSRAEFDIRSAPQPRYHLEMALLKWIHLRRLVPLADLIAGLEAGSGNPRITIPSPSRPSPSPPPRPSGPPAPMASGGAKPAATALTAAVPAPATARPDPQVQDSPSLAPPAPPEGQGFKDRFLARIKQEKKFLYSMVVAQAFRIDASGDTVTFTFAPAHRTLRDQLDQNRSWLEEMARQLAGRPISVVSQETAAAPAAEKTAAAEGAAAKDADLRARAMEHESVQALLDVFGGAEIKEIEEM